MELPTESAGVPEPFDSLPVESLSEKERAVLDQVRRQFPGAMPGRRRDDSRVCFFVMDSEFGAVFGPLG